jgi:hypothetical protein
MRVSDFRLIRFPWICGVFMLLLAACVDQDFDAPPGGGIDPGLTPTMTITELKALHTTGGYEQITGDEIIRGIVISDDTEGNFFKQLVIQDASGGIEMRIEATDLFTQYPPGRQVYVMLKGLWLGDYGGLVQLGAAVTGNGPDRELVRIPESLLDGILLKGTYGNLVQPVVLTVGQLSPSHTSTLVQLQAAQFSSPSAGTPYADADNQITKNLDVEGCNGGRTILRSSGFATFASSITPLGSGTITAVASVFNGTTQLMIRDLGDVDMDETRCGGGGGNLSIQSLHDAFTGSPTSAPSGTIKGVVISDRTTNNINNRNLYIQDETAGIVIRFVDPHTFNLRDELIVDVSGVEIAEFMGLLQLNVPNAKASSIGTKALPAPRVATVVDVLTNVTTWQSSRVTLMDVTLSGGPTFEGSITVTDASGAMILFTNSNASFVGTALPTSTVDLTAIISYFNIPQLIINSASDAGGGGTGGTDLDESFSAFANDQDIFIAGWINVAIKGTRVWRAKVFDSNPYAQATAFGDQASEMETWLITPAIDVSTPKWLTFVTAKQVWVHDGLTMLASTDFNGTDIQSATWTPVSATLAGQSDADHAWVTSGDIDLEQFSGPVFIAFRYVGSGPGGQTTSYRVDDVKVREK